MQKTYIKIYILSRAERKSYKVERVLEFYATAVWRLRIVQCTVYTYIDIMYSIYV